MNTNNLPINQQKAYQRFKNIGNTVNVFKLFFEIGYRTKQDVYIQLCIHHPVYNTPKYKSEFVLIWNCIKYDNNMVMDLNNVIDQINTK